MSIDDKKAPPNEKGAPPSAPLNPTPAFDFKRDEEVVQEIIRDPRHWFHRAMVFGAPAEALITLRTHPDLPARCSLIDINVGETDIEVFVAGWMPTIEATLDHADITGLVDGFGPAMTWAEMKADPRSQEEKDRDSLNEIYRAGERMLDRHDDPRNWAPRAIPKAAEFVLDMRRRA